MSIEFMFKLLKVEDDLNFIKLYIKINSHEFITLRDLEIAKITILGHL